MPSFWKSTEGIVTISAIAFVVLLAIGLGLYYAFGKEEKTNNDKTNENNPNVPNKNTPSPNQQQGKQVVPSNNTTPTIETTSNVTSLNNIRNNSSICRIRTI